MGGIGSGRRKLNEIRDEWLLSFESVKRWMGKETIKSHNTRAPYLYNLHMACKRFGCNPDELVAQRIRDMAEQDFVKRERLEEQIRQFRKGLLPQGESKAFMMVAAVCSFLKANTGSRLNIINTQPETKNEVWQYDGDPAGEQAFWQRIVDNAPTIRDAAAFLIGLEAGPRDGSVVAMTIGDVAGDFNRGQAPYKVRIPPPGDSPKKKSGGSGFIAADARKKVEGYLALRQSRGFKCEATDRFMVDLQTGRPIESSDVLNEALRKAFLDAGVLSHDQVYPPDARMSPVRWYSLRKRCQTVMENNMDGTGIALNWVDVLMCHKPRGAQGSKYSRASFLELRGAYAKAMHRMEIYTAAKPQATQDQINLAVTRTLHRLLSEGAATELDKFQTRVVTGRDLARILRNLTAVEAEAKQ